MVHDKTFHEIELELWSERAGLYDRIFSETSKQAINPILDSLGDLSGKHHLDVACGTGHLVAAAARRGAHAEGMDFAPSMVEAAAKNYGYVPFKKGDAQQLCYADRSFDAVTCAFGLIHMDNPHAAIKEAYRVLKSGGRFAFTLWCGPDDGNDLYRIIRTAFQLHGTTQVPLPQASTSIRFASQEQCKDILRAVGFRRPVTRILPLTWKPATSEDLLMQIEKLSITTARLLEGQREQARRLIRRSIAEQADQCRRNGRLELAWPALLATGEKP
jgi:SAM-dependent methyltransferase